MRCPKCHVKCSNLEEHTRKKHPECLDSSDEEMEDAEDSRDSGSEEEVNTRPRKGPVLRSTPARRGNPKKKDKNKVQKKQPFKSSRQKGSHASLKEMMDKVRDRAKKRKSIRDNTDSGSSGALSETEIRRIITQITERKKSLSTKKKANNKHQPILYQNNNVVYPVRDMPSLRSQTRGKRGRRECPLCNVWIVHLARHLRQRHDKSKEEAMTFIRKHRPSLKNSRFKSSGRNYRICPYEKCSARVMYMPQHLRLVHKLSKTMAVITSSRALKEVTPPPVEQNEDMQDSSDQEKDSSDQEKDSSDQEKDSSDQEKDSSDQEKDLPMPRGIQAPSLHDRDNTPANKNAARSRPPDTVSKSGTDVIPPTEVSHPHIKYFGFLRKQEDDPVNNMPPSSADNNGMVLDLSISKTPTSSCDQENQFENEGMGIDLPQEEPRDQSPDQSPRPESTTKVDIATDPKGKQKTKTVTPRKKIPWWRRYEPPITSWKQVPRIAEFYKFLLSMDRNMDEKQALQSCFQVYKIWQTVDKYFRISAILQADKLRDLWITPFITCHAPGTTKSYLASLKEFWIWLSNTNRLLPRANLTRLLSSRELWIKSLRKSSQIHRYKTMLRHTEESLKSEDFRRFKNSHIRREVMLIVNQVRHGEILEKKEWDMLVGYIMLSIAIDNAQRCGAILNLTMGALANHNKLSDGNHIIKIFHHKTSAQGPAQVVVTNDLMEMIVMYLQARRNLPGHNQSLLSPDAPLFVKWPGNCLTHSDVNRLINHVWRMSGGQQDISCTKIRKSIVTIMRSEDPSSRTQLAQHMSHSAETADAYYHLYSREKTSETITKKIRNITSSSSTESPTRQIATPDEGVTEVWFDAVSESQGSSIGSSQDNTTVQIIPHGRRTFTEQEAETIANIFSTIITTNTFFTKQQVIELINNDEQGRKIIERLKTIFSIDELYKKIYDRVRTFKRQHKQKKGKK